MLLIWVSREVEHDFDRLPEESPPLWKKTPLTSRPHLTAEPSWGIWFRNMGTGTMSGIPIRNV